MAILSEHQEKQFNLMRELLEDSLELSELLNYDEESKVLKERLERLRSAALFVIVGEVKAGKSSFVNALLRSEICEVAPDPCTSKIQEIVYGDDNETVTLSRNHERVTLDKEVLREISIVDTPGTNSIIENHQIITEEYIPQSDLIIFVFSATNPHTGSAWKFLELIQNEWRRKSLFILQQSDRASEEELKINEDRVRQYARERNVQNPLVFSVSAKNETEGVKKNDFSEFRSYIKKSISNGAIWKSKIESVRDIISSIAVKIENSLQGEKNILKEDLNFYSSLSTKLNSRRDKIYAFQEIAVNSLSNVYERQLSKLEKEFQRGLQVGNVLLRSVPLLRDKDIKSWLNDLKSEFEEEASKEIESESYKISKNISTELKSLFEELFDKIDQRYKINKSDLNLNTDRDEILADLENQLKKFKDSKILEDKANEVGNIGNFTIAGGGLATLGAVIAGVTNIVIFDITGGVLAAIGGVLIGVTLLWKRSSILNEFSKNVEDAKNEFRERLTSELDNMFDKIFHELEFIIKTPQKETEDRINSLNSLLEKVNYIREKSNDIYVNNE